MTRTNRHLNSFFPISIILYYEEIKRVTKSYLYFAFEFDVVILERPK